MRITRYTDYQDRKKEVTFTSGILITNRQARVNSFYGATGD